MHKFIPALIIIVALAIAIGIVVGSKKGDAHAAILPGAQFSKALAKSPDAVLIDVRTPEEFMSGHIKGAINIDVENPDFEKNVRALDPSSDYFIYCRSGHRSNIASEIMRNAGVTNVTELAGGISENPQLLTGQ